MGLSEELVCNLVLLMCLIVQYTMLIKWFIECATESL
jgi:hypothetical protein